MDKILTIIIPTYNMEKYLRHCLDSLIVPNMDKVEVLVINDGSKDSSSAIGHEYQDKYPQTFRVIDKENGNYGSCINRGLKEATGKYVKVLDADDSFDTTNFQEYINYLEKVDADLILNDFVEINENGAMKNKWELINLPTDKPFTFNELGYNIRMWMHAVAYKLSNILNIRGGYYQTEGISYTDQEWIFLPMSTVRTICYFKQVLYKYLVGREGQTMNSSNVIKNIWMEAKGEKTMIEQFKSLPSNALNKKYLWSRLRNRLYVIYTSCITAGKRNTFNLQQFDSWLKQNAPKLYEDSNSICVTAPKLGISVPYIRKWRDGTLKYSIKFRVWKLYRRLHYILN